MFRDNDAFASFSVGDIAAAKAFYGGTLGFELTENEMGFLDVRLAGGGKLLIYGRENHQPATFTVLNITVADIEQAVDDLVAAGVAMERYEGFNQDAKGISRDFGAIAWFTDPAGNIIALLEMP
jgi:predicted enzyme related to lactoylglutathione lyase